MLYRCSGLLLVLASEHPAGDFAFLPYRWTAREQTAWFGKGIPPQNLSTVPGHTPIVTMYYYTRDTECTADGTAFTPAQFRRLNSCSTNRLLIYDLWGPESGRVVSPLCLIPTEDIRPTGLQRELFQVKLRRKQQDNLGKRQQVSTMDKTPWIPYLLHNGCCIADYMLDNRGPRIYEGNNWNDVFSLVHQFSGVSSFEFPKGFPRNPPIYRYPLWRVHALLAATHRK